MRHLDRPTLNAYSQQYYDKWTQKIALQTTHKLKVKASGRLWKQGRNSAAVDKAIVQLHEMNNHLETCMYCEHNKTTMEMDGRLSTIIDHWEPCVRKPLRTFDWQNHFLACETCNTRLKGTQSPRWLLHPVNDDPKMHLEYIPSNGEFRVKNKSAKGKNTIKLFKLERFNADRQDVWDLILAGLQGYDKALARGDAQHASNIKEKLLKRSHHSVLYYFIDIALSPSGKTLTDPNVPDIIRRHRVDTWR